MLRIWHSRADRCKVVKGLHPIFFFCYLGRLIVVGVICTLAVFTLIEAISHEHAHSVRISHSVDLLLLVSTILLELLKNLECRRNVSLAHFVLSDEPRQSNSELLADLALYLWRKVTIRHFKPEEIKVCFFFLELLTDKVKFVR